MNANSSISPPNSQFILKQWWDIIITTLLFSGYSILPSKYQNKIHSFPIGNFQLIPVGFPFLSVFPEKPGPAVNTTFRLGCPDHQNANCCAVALSLLSILIIFSTAIQIHSYELFLLCFVEMIQS